MNYYPVNLDISGKLCVVVGGGAVATRKVASLLLCGAFVRVVSPHVSESIRDKERDGEIEWIRRGFTETDLDGAFMVFAATDKKEIQERIVARARDLDLLVNCADMPERCDFQVPAKIRRAELLLTISTGGGSPALSARIKSRLLEEFGPEYGVLVTVMSTIRSHIVGCSASAENGVLFHKILDLPLLACIRQNDWDQLQDYLTKVLPDTINSEELVSQLAEIRDEEMAKEQMNNLPTVE